MAKYEFTFNCSRVVVFYSITILKTVSVYMFLSSLSSASDLQMSTFQWLTEDSEELISA